jgi:hypothetical protein
MRPPNGNVTLVGANQALQRYNNPTGGHRQTGSDLLTALTIQDTVNAGELLADIIITPSVAARLEVLAAAWQRLRYNRLTFEVNASASSIVGGEFVAAFVSDPTDRPPLKDADKWVKAHSGSITSSWWKSMNVRGPCPPQMMYTSFEENEPRFSSPGRFVVAVVNPPTSAATMSISLSWDVSFTQPSLETFIEEDNNIYVANVSSRLAISNGSAGQTFNPYLIREEADGSFDDNDPLDNFLTAEDFTPTLPDGVLLQLPHPKTLNSDTGASGAPENAIVTHIGVADGLGRIGYFLRTEAQYFQLLPGFPFSIRPVVDSINQAGTIYDGEVENEVAALALPQSRGRRSSTLGPVLTRSSKGRMLSLLNSKRF